MSLRIYTYKSVILVLLLSFTGSFDPLYADEVGGSDGTESCFFAFDGETEQEIFSELCKKLQNVDVNRNQKRLFSDLKRAAIASLASVAVPVPIVPQAVSLGMTLKVWGTALATDMVIDSLLLTEPLNNLILYGQSDENKVALARKLAQEIDCDLLEVNWSDIKKKYAHQESACLEEFFDQMKADLKKMQVESKRKNPMIYLFINGADELIEGSSEISRDFNLELEKRKMDSGFLFVLATNRTTIWTGNILEGLVGKSPVKFRYAINQLKKADAALKSGQALPKATFKNRLLLYGPPGNGKTVMAKKIAEQAGAHYIYVNTPDLVDKYQGRTAAAVKAKFIEMNDHANKNLQPVVVAFDEMDTIAAHVSSENRADILDALKVFWHELDVIQNDSRFLVIGMTNVEEVHETLKARYGGNIQKINLPNAQVRKAVLQSYKRAYTGKPWNEKILKQLVDNSENLSIRFLEDYVRELFMVAENDNDSEITDKLAWRIFNEMKDLYVENWAKWLERQAKTRENWDSLIRVGSAVVVVAAHA